MTMSVPSWMDEVIDGKDYSIPSEAIPVDKDEGPVSAAATPVPRKSEAPAIRRASGLVVVDYSRDVDLASDAEVDFMPESLPVEVEVQVDMGVSPDHTAATGSMSMGTIQHSPATTRIYQEVEKPEVGGPELG